MRAGSLNTRAYIYRMFDKQSDTGAMTKEKALIKSVRCALIKQQGSFNNVAYEEEDSVRIVLQTWKDLSIKDTDTLIWNNQEFRITLLEYDDRSLSMKIHCLKINK